MTKTLNFTGLTDSNKIKSLYWYVFHLFERNSFNCKLRSLSWIDLIPRNILPLCCNSFEAFQSHRILPITKKLQNTNNIINIIICSNEEN